MVIAEATGQPGELLVRLKAAQRDEFLSELELAKGGAEDAIAVVSKRPRPNPAYLAARREDLEAVETLIRTIAAMTEPGEDFEVVGPAHIVCACIRSATGYVCEQLTERVHALRPGLDAERDIDIPRHQRLTDTWLRTLLAVNRFEVPRQQAPSETGEG